MRIRLMERRPETADVITFVFDLAGQPFEYRPGQFSFYELDTLDFPDARRNGSHPGPGNRLRGRARDRDPDHLFFFFCNGVATYYGSTRDEYQD